MPKRVSLAVALAATTTLATALATTQGAQASGPEPRPSPRAQSNPSTDTHASLDLRRGTSAADQRQLDRASMRLKARPAVQALTRSLGAQSIVDIDPVTATPREVSRLDGTLTGPSNAKAKDIALGYLKAHSDVFGLSAADLSRLSLARDYVDIEGIHHLSFVQTASGLTLFGNGVKANVAKDGRLINVTGSPVRSLAAPAAVARPISAAAAVEAAKKGAGEKVLTQGLRDTTKQVLFATPGGVRRAVQTVTMSGAKPALSVVDSATGRVLFRSYLSADLAADSPVVPSAARQGHTADVYDNYPGAPGAGGQAKTVNLTQRGWLAANAVKLSGNNVHTYIDINDDDVANAGEEIRPGARSYRFPLTRTYVPDQPCKAYVCTWKPNTPFSWTTNANRSSAQNFYLINLWHDYLQAAPIGFTEAAGNFQLVNKTGQGKGGDPVLDQNLDGANTNKGLPDLYHIDNANFATPPDGQSPTMQMYLWHAPGYTFAQDPFIAAMGSDEADIVFHEYTHGLSHRLVVDSNNNPALDSVQGGSMGEAWSDWYALDYLVNKGFVKDTAKPGEVQEGRYVTAGAGIRSESTDCPVGSKVAACPGTSGTEKGGYTYGDFGRIFDATGDVHAAGEIWTQTLWDLRTAVGAKRAESIVTRGMELSPTYPSYLDMRNAILQADIAAHRGADVKAIWKVFAKRGMGFFAATTSGDDLHPIEDFSVPPTTTQRGSLTGTVTDSMTGDGVPGAVVAFGGHASGLPGSYAATTSADGSYTIPGIIPGTYPDVMAGGGGYDQQVTTLNIGRGVNTRDWSLVRDWAASSGGAAVTAFNGPDYSLFGCGPSAIIDQSLGSGWGSDAGTPKYVVIKLPAAVDITQVAIDPSNTCGDGPEAATAGYKVETSPDGTTWTTASQGTFDASNLGHLNPLTPTAGASGVRYVRYTMVDPQGGPAVPFLDSSEVAVYGAPSS